MRSESPHGGARILGKSLLALALAAAPWLQRPAYAQTDAARPLITAPLDMNQRVRLKGNTRPEANGLNDRGRIPDTFGLDHLQLLLRRSAEREAALRQYLKELHDRTSPNFHHWLSVSQFARRFGLVQQDLGAVTGWLRQQGFTVNTVYPSTLVIDFSGTAGQVFAAFHTEIHYLSIGGARHIANMGDPEIPAALAPAVAGIVSLHDFRPHTNFKPKPAYTFSSGETTRYAVVPADLATIYNLNPLFSAGISGQGQTIVVIEDTNVYSTADWTVFRSTFGLSSYSSGSFTQVHPAPSGTNNCTNPGVVAGNESEAELDAEWASAAAPSAAVVLASCQDTTTMFGGLIALENLVNGGSPPAIVSISYGECEAENGATANAAYNEVYQQAVALGTSIFVSAGDEGAASCDADQSKSTHGIGVSGFASTPYNVAVGGTDFGDNYAGTTGSYWSATNSATYASALSYVPEIPWNDSCASSLIAAAEGYGTSYGTGGFCNSTAGIKNFLTTASGSGGPSGCATGAPSTSGVVSATCQGYSKPSWQSVTGNPADGVRDTPDVSLFAANGVWGHYYVYCDSDTSDKGVACTGAPSGWSGAGGTSFASPIMAGFQALVNQKTGSLQGNPNYVYYPLAAGQYASGLACNSSLGNAASSGCVFHDVTLGDMDVNCQGQNSCYDPSGSNGVLSTSTGSFANAYGAGVGWDFASGLGTINAYNLVNFWNSAELSLSGGGDVTPAGLLSYAWVVGNGGPQAATGVVVSTVLPAGLTLVAGASSSGCTQSGQTVSCTVGNIAEGSNASLTIVINPGNTQTANLTFSATSNNGDINPNNGVVMTSLNLPSGAANVPLPSWALCAFAAALFGVARRQLKVA